MSLLAESDIAPTLRRMRSIVNATCVTHFAKLGMMDTPGKRLKWAREQNTRFETATEAAQAFGWKVSTYLGHENGDRIPSRKNAIKYARAYKVRWEWILEGDGAAMDKRVLKKHAVGYVGAGAEIIPFDSVGGEDDVELPPGAPPETEVAVVRGNSMYPRYFDGEKIFYLPIARPVAELIGQECIVKLKDGRMLVKIVRRGKGKNRVNLESWNAPLLEDQAIEWAAPVRWRG